MKILLCLNSTVTWRINTKILSTCRGRRHIVSAGRLQLVFILSSHLTLTFCLTSMFLHSDRQLGSFCNVSVGKALRSAKARCSYMSDVLSDSSDQCQSNKSRISTRYSVVKWCDIFWGVETYSYPSYIFSGGQDSPTFP